MKARFTLRGDARVKDFIAFAAKERHTSLSQFMIEAALEKAQQILAEKRHFILDEAQWQAFTGLLDRPVQEKPALRKLLYEKSMFE